MQSNTVETRVMYFAGINVGHGHVKVQTDSAYFQYASLVQRANDRLAMGALRGNAQRVVVDGIAYDVGDDVALSGDLSLSRTVFGHWGDSDIYRVLRQSVLERMAGESLGPWVVMLGIPVAQFKVLAYRRALVAGWRGTHSTARGELRILHAGATPEPLGSFWEYASRGPAQRQQLAAGDVVIVDFGYFTTDINAVRRMVLNTHIADSIDKGMRDVYRAVGDLLLSRHGVNCSDVEVEMALLGQWPMLVSGQPIDLAAIVDEVLEQIGADLLHWMRAIMGRASGLILTTGGGAHLMTALVRKAFPRVEVVMVPEPQAANARGYHRMATSIPKALTAEAIQRDEPRPVR